MAATMIPTARIHDACRQNRLNSISNMRYSNATSITLSTNTKLPSVHILLTKPNPTVGLDSCTGGAGRNAHFERRHDNDVEDNEEHAVHPAGEGACGGVGGVTSLASTFWLKAWKWGFTVVVLLVFSLIRLFPYADFSKGILLPLNLGKSIVPLFFLTVS